MLLLESLVVALAGAGALLLLLSQLRPARPSITGKSVALVVLGDIGRSPRMLYHAQSFARHGYTTHILAYRGSVPPQELVRDPHVRLIYLDTPTAWVSALPKPLFVLLLPLKVVVGAWTLLRALMALPVAPALLFVQNPPAIPTLFIVQLAARLRGSRVVIDWHNTGYSVLALRLGFRHIVVRLAKFLELSFGRKAFLHLCVSNAMKYQLGKQAKLRGQVVTFHDRPPSSFRRQTEQEAHELFLRLPVLRSIEFLPEVLDVPPQAGGTLFTTPDGKLAPIRPALLVSATSWTLDEDFHLLLQALDIYEHAARALARGPAEAKESHAESGTDEKDTQRMRQLPPLAVLITGRGAGRAAFEREVERREAGEDGWRWVRVRTAWLEREDYPRLLGSADLGVSLHTSTSGIDLPMKVVDMFGCGLPVVALDFPCVGELVQDEINGRTFRNAEDLADRFMTLLRGHPQPFSSDLDKLRVGITEAKYGDSLGHAGGDDITSRGTSRWGSWEESWDQIVAPLLAPSS